MKKALALTLISVLLVLALAGTLLIRVGIANPANYYYITPALPIIYVSSPVNNCTYGGKNGIDLTFTVPVSWGYYGFSPIQYWVDGGLKGEVDVGTVCGRYQGVLATVVLSGLSDGVHTLQVTVKDVKWWSGDWVVRFASPFSFYPGISVDYGVLSSPLISFTTDSTPPGIMMLSGRIKPMTQAQSACR